MSNFFKSPSLYTGLAIITITIGLCLTFIASGLGNTYYPDDAATHRTLMATTLVPTLILTVVFIYISRRLSRRK